MACSGMELKKLLARLKSLGNDRVRAHNKKAGAGEGQFGVPLGEIRKVAAGIGSDHQLAVDLWETGIIDAQLLAILLFKPKDLSTSELDRMVRSITFSQVADWFNEIGRAHV